MATEKSFKTELQALLEEHADLEATRLRRMVADEMFDWEKARGCPVPNKGKPWTDDQLRVVLSDAPTRENCLKHARALGRGYGSIEQVYRWASTPDKVVKEGRGDHKFVAQIKQIARELVWRA